MRSDLEAALRDEAWAFSGAVMGLLHVLDDEGRALHERRAPSEYRQGAPLLLVACPYTDGREGQPMNGDALRQAKPHLGRLVKDIAAFHEAWSGDTRGWDAMFEAVLDQLSKPARYLLHTRNPVGPIPAEVAVSHKLAAGFFGAFKVLLREEAKGRRRPVSVDDFLAMVGEHGTLIGASEVCAGPPQMIERFTRLFLHGRAGETRCVEDDRLAVARLLATQVKTGVVFSVVDEALEHALLIGCGEGALRARTTFFQTKLDERRRVLSSVVPGRWECAAAALPAGLDAGLRDGVADAILACGSDGEAPDETTIDELIALGDGAVEIDPTHRATVGRALASFTMVYQRCLQALYDQELKIREVLGFATAVPMAINGVILPSPKVQRLLEAVTGHRWCCPPGDRRAPTLRNHRREVALTASLA